MGLAGFGFVYCCIKCCCWCEVLLGHSSDDHMLCGLALNALSVGFYRLLMLVMLGRDDSSWKLTEDL